MQRKSQSFHSEGRDENIFRRGNNKKQSWINNCPRCRDQGREERESNNLVASLAFETPLCSRFAHTK